MTPHDLLPSLSLIADRYLARAKAELEERGIDTAEMPPTEIFDLAAKGGTGARPQDSRAPEPAGRRQARRTRERGEVRGHRIWRHDWRRRSGLRPRIGKRIKQQD